MIVKLSFRLFIVPLIHDLVLNLLNLLNFRGFSKVLFSSLSALMINAMLCNVAIQQYVKDGGPCSGPIFVSGGPACRPGGPNEPPVNMLKYTLL